MERKIVASTMICRLFSYEGALRKLKSLGVDKVELLSMPKDEWVPHFDSLHASESYMDWMAERAKEIGIQIVSLNGWYGMPDGKFTAEGLIRMENAMRLASKLGAKIVTGDCGAIAVGADRAARLREIADFQRIAADLADNYGIQYCVEAPHRNTIASLEAELEEYWGAMDPRIRMTFDPAHLVYSGEDPYKILKKYIDRVAHVHIRDAIEGNSLLHYGKGCIDFNAILSILKEADYHGFVTMEFPVDDLGELDNRVKESLEFVSKLNFD